MPIERDKVLAIRVSEKGVIFNLKAQGYFMDTIYACRYENDKFIIESHGPELSPTHWMPLPEPPKVGK